MARFGLRRNTQVQERSDGRAPAVTRTQRSSRWEVPSEAIAKRAYEKFLARGGRHGDDWRDWFEAEQELKTETQRN